MKNVSPLRKAALTLTGVAVAGAVSIPMVIDAGPATAAAPMSVAQCVKNGTNQLNVMTEALGDAGKRVSHYLSLQGLVNACVGLVIGVGLYFIGVPNAALWGIVAGVLRVVPYVGTITASLLPMALSLAVFDSSGGKRNRPQPQRYSEQRGGGARGSATAGEHDAIDSQPQRREGPEKKLQGE